MENYPFSYSSKKLKSSSNSLNEKSACQKTNPNIVKRQDYCHILKGEKVFIELYYQGRVIETAYNQWISVFGGTLYKRLHHKVSIFLTNADQKQYHAIKERINKSCPTCHVVSILWFEQCFKKKEKVPFDDFLIEKDFENKPYQEDTQQPRYDEEEVQKFMKNITEDISQEYKQFFKVNKNTFFQYAGKNSKFAEEQIMRVKQFDLGPKLNKKKQNRSSLHISKPQIKLDEPAKKRRISRKKRTSVTSKKQQKIKEKDNEVIEVNEEIHQNTQEVEEIYQFKPVNFNDILYKYLDKQDDDLPNQEEQRNSKQKYSSKQTEVVDLVNDNQPLSQQKTASPKKIFPVVNRNQQQSYQKKNLYQSKFKSARQQLKKKQVQKQINQVLQIIEHQPENSIIIVSESVNISRKIQEINSKRKATAQTTIKLIKVKPYWNLINQQKIEHKAYYLFNPKRKTDRPLSYALKTKSPFLSVVSYRLLEEIAYNNKIIRENYQKLSKKTSSLKYLKQIEVSPEKTSIQGKRVLFNKTDDNIGIYEYILNELEAINVKSNDYFKGAPIDIIVNKVEKNSNVFETRSMDEEEFWKMVFPD